MIENDKIWSITKGLILSGTDLASLFIAADIQYSVLYQKLIRKVTLVLKGIQCGISRVIVKKGRWDRVHR